MEENSLENKEVLNEETVDTNSIVEDKSSESELSSGENTLKTNKKKNKNKNK